MQSDVTTGHTSGGARVLAVLPNPGFPTNKQQTIFTSRQQSASVVVVEGWVRAGMMWKKRLESFETKVSKN